MRVVNHSFTSSKNAEVKRELALGEFIMELENGEVAPFVCPDESAISFQLPDIHGFFSHDNSLLR